MRNSPSQYLLILLLIAIPLVSINGQGISFDAGLTPAQNRLILRSQFRSFSTTDGIITTSTQMVPLVVAYGIRPGFALMFRNTYNRQKYSNSNEVLNRLMDPFLLAKFRLYRKNTAAWVLGIAPHIATNIPLRSTGMGTVTWNPELGMNVSFRPRFLSFDLSTVFRYNDIFDMDEAYKGLDFSTNAAFSFLLPMTPEGEIAVAPVVEMNYLRRKIDGVNGSSFRDLMFISPGASLITDFLALEILLQVPVYQADRLGNTVQSSRAIAGLKFMF